MISQNYEAVFENDENGKWVSKLEAALHFGKTERTIENRMRSGNLQHRLDEDGKVLIFIRDSKLSKRPEGEGGNLSNGFEGAFVRTSKDFEAFAESQKQLSKTLETTIEKLETNLETLEIDLSQTKDALMESRIKNAQIEGELKNSQSLIEELRNRVQDKDTLILSLNREVELQKERAELLQNKLETAHQDINNQLKAAHGKIQEYKSQEQFMKELKKQVEALQAAQNITIKTETAPAQEPSKSFSFFGFEIRRSK